MLGGNTADSFSGLFYLCGRYTRKNKLKKMLVLLFTFGDFASCAGFFCLCGLRFYHLLPILKVN